MVLYDALINREVLNYTKPDCLKIYVGKRDSRHSLPQEEIKIVVRLKGGDPFLSSASIPLTHRDIASSFAVVTGHPNRGINWRAFAHIDTLVILMGVKNRSKIARELIKAGRDPSEPVAFIERATTPPSEGDIHDPLRALHRPARGQNPRGYDSGKGG